MRRRGQREILRSRGTCMESSKMSRDRVLCGSVVKNLPANAGDTDSIPGSGKSLGVGNGNSLQGSCLGNPMDKGAWWGTVHGVSKPDSTEFTYTHKVGAGGL